MITLKYPRFPSPFWFLGEHEKLGTVLPEGTVLVDSAKEILQIQEGELPPPGTVLILTPNLFDIKAETEESCCKRIERAEQERQSLHQEEKELRILRDLRLKPYSLVNADHQQNKFCFCPTLLFGLPSFSTSSLWNTDTGSKHTSLRIAIK
ncbi:hypothetical protein [Photorhabdus bodei]|uniref:Uncharacterized protein n=1 Tax=Photorhabdus bodei TaxID=2029681 RepID=A0AAW6BML1_9GAMM|nr:hypothetical protein [Photorhabdus bodei]MDB6373885.1 hypothetical protein [Photorhabdus bodei]